MREIKFRGKRLDNGEWVYGYYVRYEHMGNVKHIIVTDWAQVYVNSYYVIPETVGQYTGLKDKNGKEIYEGDILKLHNGKIRTVFRVKGGFAMESLDMDVGKYGKTFCCPIDSLADEQNAGYIEDQSEVIGDIYNNPELLESGE